jgi:hypothetical protein
MKLNLVDALALVLGVFYAVQWSSLRRAHAAQAPGSQDALRQRVQRSEVRAVTLMTSVCFGKIVLELAVQGLGPSFGIPRRLEALTSMGMDLCWMALMFVGLGMRASTRRQRAKLGIPSP